MTGRDDGGRQAGEGAAYWLARLQADDSDAGDLDRFAAWRDVDPANSETYDRFSPCDIAMRCFSAGARRPSTSDGE